MRNQPSHPLRRLVAAAVRRSRLVAAGTGLILALGLPMPAAADPGDAGDQPLPGYTVSIPPLAPAVVDGRPSSVRSGVHAHAGYLIEVPPRWNGDLVLWAHGYRGLGTVLSPEAPGFDLRQRLLNQGYAWASSSYYDNGFDIRAGVLGTQDLAGVFGRAVGRPHRVLLAGVSMGGYVIGRSLEEYPGFYAGALPMCGVLGDQRLLDFYLDYNLVAQDLAGVSAYPLPADYMTAVVPGIERTLGLAGLTPGGPDTTTDRGRQLRAITINRSGGPRPGAEAAFAVWKDFLFSIATTDGGDSPAQRPGQLATNVLTRYRPDAPAPVNATVRRVLPENLWQRLSPGLTQVPRISGRPGAPVLSLHDLGDLFVPFGMEQDYRADVIRNRQGRFLVQRAVRAAQHCEFSPAEVGAAWDDLARWVRDGIRPAGDDVSDPRVVASAGYGCRFSDPAAYAAGGGTRRLFPACP
ncbi:hypothetical protein ACFFWC_19665 [Plantactinospora siamensis]|uniref:O-phthalyl amidase n=1 Tax=Plantactinospora siamensis TaxID=555372 RepID=A0ABV6P4Q2_9ACTN